MNPDAYTNQELLLNVGDGHQIYVQDWGNKRAAIPFIVFHGGPGSQAKDRHRDIYNPAAHRVIFFDQRGCGKSLPYGSLEHNTTQDLLNDAVKILDHLGITHVYAAGSSWGSTLALLFAQQHPQRVRGVVVSGIYLASRTENAWVANGQFSPFYPEIWETFLSRTPQDHHDDPSAYHYARVLGNDPAQARESALAIEEMEHSLMNLDDRSHPIDPATFDPTAARIYTHYLTHNCFLPAGHIMKNAHKLTMPVWLVQGRYDMVCPPHTAIALANAIPGSKLYLTIGSHRAEHETWSILRAITAELAAAAGKRS